VSTERLAVLAGADNLEFVRTLFRAQIARGELEVPVLPEVATRVIAMADASDTDAAALSRLILADPPLAAHVMRVATSAIYQPRRSIQSLHTAISWLGVAEVCDIAFAAVVEAKLLNVPGQKARAQRIWRQAVACALWARLVAEATGGGADTRYLSGLLHEIGRPVCLQAVLDLSRRAATPLVDEDIETLIGEFHVDVGRQLASRWKLPDGVVQAIKSWAQWADAGAYAGSCAVVYLAHRLAELTGATAGPIDTALLALDPVCEYLGLGADGLEALAARADHVRAEMAGS
jgi:HD-like signal output (HDOD) protein